LQYLLWEIFGGVKSNVKKDKIGEIFSRGEIKSLKDKLELCMICRGESIVVIKGPR
jgi:hypothetical protein